jgi:hypothetical protein
MGSECCIIVEERVGLASGPPCSAKNGEQNRVAVGIAAKFTKMLA